MATNRKKIKRLHYKDHQLIGERLQRQSRELVDLFFQLQEVYGKSDNACQEIRHVSTHLLRLRSEMDDKVCCENPRSLDEERGIKPHDVYFGNSGGVLMS